MDNDFEGTSTLLSGARSRIDGLLKTSSGLHMCYLAVFVVFVFVVLWKAFK